MKRALFLVLVAAALAQTPAGLSDRARQLASEHRFDQAEKLWRQALSLDPDYFPALFNLGYMYFSSGHPAESRLWLEGAVRVQPKDFNSRYLLGSGAAVGRRSRRRPAAVEAGARYPAGPLEAHAGDDRRVRKRAVL